MTNPTESDFSPKNLFTKDMIVKYEILIIWAALLIFRTSQSLCEGSVLEKHAYFTRSSGGNLGEKP